MPVSVFCLNLWLLCWCWCCRDPAWFSESWLGRIKSDVEDNWRLKVPSSLFLHWCSTVEGVSVRECTWTWAALWPLLFTAASQLQRGCLKWMCVNIDYKKLFKWPFFACLQLNNLKKILQQVVDYYNEVGRDSVYLMQFKWRTTFYCVWVVKLLDEIPFKMSFPFSAVRF